MSARAELNVPLIAADVLAIVAALVFGLRTPDGGRDGSGSSWLRQDSWSWSPA